jgi:hypothetical protein
MDDFWKKAQAPGIARSVELDAPIFVEYEDEHKSFAPSGDRQSKDRPRLSGTDKTMARILQYQELGLHVS